MSDSGFDIGPDGRLERRLNRAFRSQEEAGLRLVAMLRVVAMLAITVWLFVLLGRAAWFYLPITSLFALAGIVHLWMFRRKWGGNLHAYLFFSLDVVLITLALFAPNPFLDADTIGYVWPAQMTVRFGSFNYYYLLIALFALGSYSARAMLFAGVACIVGWGAGIAWIATLPDTLFDIPSFTDSEGRLTRFLDPHYVSLDVRTTEVIVMLLATTVLATAVMRGRRLVREQVLAARERSNLARYFTPNIVDELAGYDGALESVQSQEVAVLFADVVGSTRLAEHVTPEELIELLRALHARLERAVFDNGGTLDKYLGDGVMATFGTPRTSPQDAANALRCARTMLRMVDEWNVRRRAGGYPEVPLAIGLHYGPVVMGDIGSERRLEFAVIGDTVNVASRLEEATRAAGTRLLASDDLMRALHASAPDDLKVLCDGVEPYKGLVLRGRDSVTDAWMLNESATARD